MLCTEFATFIDQHLSLGLPVTVAGPVGGFLSEFLAGEYEARG